MQRDSKLNDEIIRLYESEPNLHTLPGVLFAGVGRLIDAEVVSFTEFHRPSWDFRSLISVGDDPDVRARGMQAFAKHMHSHPFWQHDPTFYGERALRESDFFSDEEFVELPIAKEVFLPSRARRIMGITFEHAGYVVTVVGHRVVGRPAFSDDERDWMQGFRPHILRSYRQAQERTLAALTPGDRLRLAFPALTPRQIEVASWIAQGKSNEEIAGILGVGLDAVKAHVKAINSKIDSDSRRAAIVIAHTTPPFADLPPLWKLGLEG
ncbi:helix-turn-helix transcriptional regulator [Bradyrhizobium tropiciagri]|uniref:helix-turn-helix transcriptional regulator n=1 Tax=Bradyrhizobium tropiciagri TaxID=312253 RepID=UPI001BA9C328|nr:helix-turn-helix transcriptional regulator [Bradyrhizobium tropiciagri]MBR0900415.1 helix-turn-helix transcriptional regulator [Bradyrhizobium tropiciagri]